MGNLWDDIKSTTETLGSAAGAPAGLVYDIASMPFDNKDDNIGTVVHAASSRLGDALSPVISPKGNLVTGLTDTMAAMNWAWQQVSEGVGTANMVNRHAFGGAGLWGPVGWLAATVTGRADWGAFADPKSWSEAYKRANQQENALGAAFAYGALHPNSDPLAEANPYQTIQNEHGSLATGLAWTGEIAGMFALDPTTFALKGVGKSRAIWQYGKLSAAEKANMGKILTGEVAPGKGRNFERRTDKLLDYLYGTDAAGKKTNPMARPLTGPEIKTIPEINRYAKDPEAISGFLADANKITDFTQRRNVQRRILAIAAGDLNEVDRLRAEASELPTIADQITNMAREGVMDLDALAVAPGLANNPIFRLRLENQLGNLNKDGAVDKFIDDFASYTDRLLETQKSLPNLPGVHLQSKKAISRLNDAGLARKPKNTLDDWAAKYAERAESSSTVFQKGKYTVPLVAVRTVGLMASPWTRLPVAVSDSLRTPAFTGIASIHDWGTATQQLDAMMRIGRVPVHVRNGLLTEAYTATTEGEKIGLIHRVERASVQHLAAWASERSGRKITPGYIDALMEQGAAERGDRLTSIAGRIYAATDMTPEVSSRLASAGRVEDATALGATSKAADAGGRLGGGATAKSQGEWKWRLDQINDDGTPLALPVFETQLGNHVPLFNIDIAHKVLSRDTGLLSRLSHAWEDQANELGRLWKLKAAGATGVEKAIEARAFARDWLVDIGQMVLRAWKFSVLFRLGYPMRVLTDDHLRIISKIGAGAFYGANLREFAGNVRQNFGRRVEGRAAIHGLQVRKQEILDELDSGEMTSHFGLQGELKTVNRKIAAHDRTLAGLRTRVAAEESKASLGLPNDLHALQVKLAEREKSLADHVASRDFLMEQLGDYGPTELKRELDDINAHIRAGAKAQRRTRKRVGDNDVNVQGTAFPGAFADEFGGVLRDATGSGGVIDAMMRGTEERTYRALSRGSHTTYGKDDVGYFDVWAHVLNHQFATSEIAKFFLRGGTPEEFATWIKAAEQATLRRRVPHFAHDPLDWGNRSYGIVNNYVPTQELRDAVLAGRVTPKQLRDTIPDSLRPSVHGRAAADNFGDTHAVRSFGRAVNRLFRWFAEAPVDTLSRHPYFNSLYKMHVKDFGAVRMASGRGAFTPQDIEEVAHLARRAALKDLRSTLYELSSHSNAAQVMRFISPFFAAHQEGVMRWWRIAADKPEIVRRFMMVMDVPRYLQIEVDENGDLVKPGDALSANHRILMQLPQAYGGKSPVDHYENGKLVPGFQSQWKISEQAGNIILQGGLTNPGAGPLVSVPFDWAAQTFADEPMLARVARLANPYPPTNPLDNIMPAVVKRLSAATYGYTKEHFGHGVDPSLIGVGKREYNDAFNRNVQDMQVDFYLEHGRYPTRDEAGELVKRAGAETTTMMFHRVLWNLGSPAPASPSGKYTAIQQGWYKIQEQARAEGRDFTWAYDKFKAKYGEAYLPLTLSTSNNPGWVDANAADVAAIKHYRPVLQDVDPALTRMVIGAYADDMIEKNKTLGDYAPDARNYLRNQAIKPGSEETYYSYDDPAAAMAERQARIGWQKYGQLTASLTAMASQAGIKDYMMTGNLSDEQRQIALGLQDVRSKAIAALEQENYAWADQWKRGGDEGQYDRYLDDMRQIAKAPVLSGDAERTDIKTLSLYLQLHDFFAQVFAARKAAGYGGVDASSQEAVRTAYTELVGALVESNIAFEEHMYNGIIERDPWLIRDAA